MPLARPGFRIREEGQGKLALSVGLNLSPRSHKNYQVRCSVGVISVLGRQRQKDPGACLICEPKSYERLFSVNSDKVDGVPEIYTAGCL